MHPYVVCHPRGQTFVNIQVDESVFIGQSRSNVVQLVHLAHAYMALLDDTPLGRSTKPLYLYKEFLWQLLLAPFEVIRMYKGISGKLLSSLISDVPFQAEFKSTPIFFEYKRWYDITRGLRDEDDPALGPKLLTYLLTFLNFAKKLELVMDELKPQAFRSWEDTEARIGIARSYNVSDLRTFLSAVLPDPDYEDFLPKFGPGLTADLKTRSQIEKTSHLRLDPHLKRFVESVFVKSKDPTRSFLDTLPFPLTVWPKEPNELVFVPSDPSKVRSICMCTNAEMFFQQGVLNMFKRAFKRSSVLRSCIILEDQTFNQRGAKLGSIYHQYDTLDLSAASDSVSLDLVKRIFPRKWLYPLLATRNSRVVTPDGSVRSLKKFAPMGSAVCFPVQCLIFLGLVYSSTLQWALDGGLTSTIPETREEVLYFWNHFVEKTEDPYTSTTDVVLSPLVYGDDIICDHKITDFVVDSLEQCGFVINKAKSFTGDSCFRESCGKYYHNGHDVTPFHLKTPMHTCVDPNTFASIWDQCKLLLDYGFYGLRTYLLKYLEVKASRSLSRILQKFKVPLLELTDLRRTPIVRTNQQYQREECLELSVVNRSRVPMPNALLRWESMSYYLWMHTRRIDEETFPHRRRVPSEVRYKLTWIPFTG